MIFANLNKVKIAIVLGLGTFGSVLDFDDILTLYKINGDTVHVGGKGICIAHLAQGHSGVTVGGTEYLLVIGAAVDGVLGSAHLIVLESEVQNHFINTGFGNGYLVNQCLAGVFNNIPVRKSTCAGNAGRLGKLGIIVACPNVNAVLVAVHQLLGEVVNVIFAVAVRIVIGGHRIGGDNSITATCTYSIEVGVNTCCRNRLCLLIAANRAGEHLLTRLNTSGRFDNALFVGVCNSGIDRSHSCSTTNCAGFGLFTCRTASGLFGDNRFAVGVLTNNVKVYFHPCSTCTHSSIKAGIDASGVHQRDVLIVNVLVSSYIGSGLFRGCFNRCGYNSCVGSCSQRCQQVSRQAAAKKQRQKG